MGRMLGGAVRDALGNPVVFMTLTQIHAAHGPDGPGDMFRLLPSEWLDAMGGRRALVKITYDLLTEPTSHSYWTDRYPL